MSKAAKQSVIILLILLIIALGFSFMIMMDKKKVEQAKIAVEKQLEDSEKREKESILKNKDFQGKIDEVEKARQALEDRLGGFDVDFVGMEAKVKKLTKERDVLQGELVSWKERTGEWKLKSDEKQERLADVVKERDGLLQRLQEQPKEKIVYVQPEEVFSPTATKRVSRAEVDLGSIDYEDEIFWGQILKDKADLELTLEELHDELTGKMIEIEDLKKQNSDLEIEISSLGNEKEGLVWDIKHGQDLANSLSLDLARSKNNQKFLSSRVDKLGDENANLYEQVKQLTSTKIALEKSIVKIQKDKEGVAKKLAETEHVIQGRIDEIWRLKESLDDAFQPSEDDDFSSSNEIELSPIVVTAEDELLSQIEQVPQQPLGFDGNVASINSDNNFVIVDVGETSGIQIGDRLNVYRGVDYIAGLEIIQVRRDIAAADIKDQVVPIQIGDNVR
ncbi:MAG: hypothetical protein KAJ18_04730 [Candidatus Omnitrophica bacterium]|nr:hypothetical protein [Candidatus Omnitrophota bacterium]